MSEPYIGEIRIFGFDFAPRGWALCDGQLLPISQNQSLYSILGTSYGGDGITSFALPDLRGRTPVHVGVGLSRGTSGGEEEVFLQVEELPSHTHDVMVSNDNGSDGNPAGKVLSKAFPGFSTHGPAGSVAMNAAQIAPVGNDLGHDNMQPFLTLSFCIALEGIFPPRN